MPTLQSFSHEKAVGPVNGEAQPAPDLHPGMPPLDLSGKQLSFFEFWPTKLFYIPIGVQWLWLSLKFRGLTLPTLANPGFPFGGLIGESKSRILDLAGPAARARIAPWILVRGAADQGRPGLDCRRIQERLDSAGLSFPLVAKPDIGCRGAGVRLLRGPRDLAGYLAGFPQDCDLVLQRYVPHEGEAGVFYVKLPGESKGKLLSVTLKYFPKVVGDGRATLRELIARDPRARRVARLYIRRHRARLNEVIPEGEPYRLVFSGSHCRGAIFRDGRPYVTPAMTEAFEEIARDLPEFYFGRFDVRFPDIESLRRGEDFTVVEINGAGSEGTHIWDRKTTLLEAYRSLMEQSALLYEVGFRNRARGFRPANLRQVWRVYWSEKRLVAQYPSTD